MCTIQLDIIVGKGYRVGIQVVVLHVAPVELAALEERCCQVWQVDTVGVKTKQALLENRGAHGGDPGAPEVNAYNRVLDYALDLCVSKPNVGVSADRDAPPHVLASGIVGVGVWYQAGLPDTKRDITPRYPYLRLRSHEQSWIVKIVVNVNYQDTIDAQVLGSHLALSRRSQLAVKRRYGRPVDRVSVYRHEITPGWAITALCIYPPQ